MRRSVYPLAALTLLLGGTVLFNGGCRKRVTPPPPPAPAPAPAPAAAPAPAPTITLSAAPSTVNRGQASTLTWRAQNATSVSIDGGVGNVETSGTRSVSPTAPTTYTASATGPGGRAPRSARVTVTDETPVTPAPAPSLSDAEIFRTRVADVYFDYDKYDIRADARGVLNENARVLSDRRGIRFVIEGHCDERGSEKYNLALGDRRANCTKEYLVGQGVGSERIETISLGEERPFDPGHTEDACAKNRRAHFVMK